MFFNNVHETLHQDFQSDVIYLDFAKAFDSVPHNELLLKLRSVGVTDDLWHWFQNYLAGRQQCVSLGCSCSRMLPVVSGVPQGSILGPLMFLIYINDLASTPLRSHLFLFAYDAKCLQRIEDLSDCENLQQDLNSLCDWSHEWKLRFRSQMCLTAIQCLWNPLFNINYYINGFELPSTLIHKDLGLMVSHDLSWDTHYDYLASRAYKTIGLLRRNFSSTDSIFKKKLLYILLVCSQLTYCSQPYLIKDIVKLENIQQRATKYILNQYSINYKSRLEALKLLPLMYLFQINDIMFCIKILKSSVDHFNTKYFISFSNNATRSGFHSKMCHSRSTTRVSSHLYFNRSPDCETLCLRLI